jgi:hypothetical protein
MDMQIRIVDIPPGEAPVEVRRAWIGITLPLAPGANGPKRVLGVGVLSGPRGVLSTILHIILGRAHRIAGYSVEARVAFKKLEAHAPEAAAWWRLNTPHLEEGNYTLVFHHDVCELVDQGGNSGSAELPS